jgi:hypothetical protein
MKIRVMSSALIVLGFVVIGRSVDPMTPDFSGRWILNKVKSHEAYPKMFKRRTMEVSQHDASLDAEIRDEEPDGSEFRAYLNLKTDGTPTVAILGAPQHVVARWQGRSLMIRWNLDQPASGQSNGAPQGATPAFTWTWSLFEDGKALVNQIHVYDANGDILERLVYEKAK